MRTVSSWPTWFSSPGQFQICGFFDPVGNYVAIVLDDEDGLNQLLSTLNHEHNHLVGIIGRHLQINLVDDCLNKGIHSHAIVESERGLIESLVVIWMSQFGNTPESALSFPESDPSIVRRLQKTCDDICAGHWVVDGIHIDVQTWRALLAVQQAVLNVTESPPGYSANASIAALDFLSHCAANMRDRTIDLRVELHGEWQRLYMAIRDVEQLPSLVQDPGGSHIGNVMELFLAHLLREGTGLYTTRYTAHERCHMVLEWLILVSESDDARRTLPLVIGTLAAVFVPWAFIPLVLMRRQKDGALGVIAFGSPHGAPSRVIRRSHASEMKGPIATPAVLRYTDMLDDILESLPETSDCRLMTEMRRCYLVGMCDAVRIPLDEGIGIFLRQVSLSLQMVLDSLRRTTCPQCRQLRQSLSNNALRSLNRVLGSIWHEASVDHTHVILERAAAPVLRGD